MEKSNNLPALPFVEWEALVEAAREANYDRESTTQILMREMPWTAYRLIEMSSNEAEAVLRVCVKCQGYYRTGLMSKLMDAGVEFGEVG